MGGWTSTFIPSSFIHTQMGASSILWFAFINVQCREDGSQEKKREFFSKLKTLTSRLNMNLFTSQLLLPNISVLVHVALHTSLMNHFETCLHTLIRIFSNFSKGSEFVFSCQLKCPSIIHSINHPFNHSSIHYLPLIRDRVGEAMQCFMPRCLISD